MKDVRERKDVRTVVNLVQKPTRWPSVWLHLDEVNGRRLWSVISDAGHEICTGETYPTTEQIELVLLWPHDREMSDAWP